MYTLINANVREKTAGSQWTTATLNNTVIATAMNTYSDILLVLTNPFLEGEHLFDVFKDMDSIDVRNVTFNQWLTAINDDALPTVKGHVEIKNSHVTYMDAFQAKFHARCVNPDTHPDTPAPANYLKDVLVTRPNTDYQAVSGKCLFTCGGILHPHYATPDGINIIGAGESLSVSNNNNLGVINFEKIGTVKTIPITEDMIGRVIDSQPLYHTVAINVGEDVSEKQLGIVIGGALHILDGVVHKNSPTGVLVYLSKIDLRARYNYLLDKINLSTLVDTFGVVDYEVLRREHFQTDGFVQALMTLPQTFLVVIDSDIMFRNIQGLEAGNLPFTGYTYGEIEGIVRNVQHYCVSARIVRFKDINKINGEIRLQSYPGRLSAPDEDITGVDESLSTSRPLKNELDHVLWLGTQALSIIED